MSPSEAITKLQSARQDVDSTTPANPEQAKAKQDLLKQIDERIAVCLKEQELRRVYDVNKTALATIKKKIEQSDAVINNHEKLKKQVYAKYPKRPLSISDLSPADQARYQASQQKRNEARAKKAQLERSSSVLENQASQVQRDYTALLKANAVGGKLPATPTDSVCIPCVKKQADDFADKQRRQKGGKDVYPGHQNYYNCGVQSANQLITAENKGIPKNEEALLIQALKDNHAKDVWFGKMRRHFGEKTTGAGGTSAVDRQKILAKNGVDSEVIKTTPDTLAKAIKENKGIIVNVDAGVFWNSSQDVGTGHAIVVYDGDFDKNGNLTDVYINDTGSGVQGRKMTIKEFMAATDAYKPESSLNVTKNPVW